MTGAAKPDDDRLRVVFNTIEPLIERRWGIPVTVTDVPNPFTGDLDGERILVEHDLDVEDAVFILVHLFGHTVQWNVSARAREIGMARPSNWTEPQLAELTEYEHQACRYSLQLLHEAGIRDLDQWISDFAACDCAYLMHLYRTGEKVEFKSFWKDNAPLVTPLAIPEFHPTRWISRYEGTVV
ncbi:MAG: hypothetical protein H0V17_28170 [Deltaproteobacteria bacterium]|nr:hypothetical protein [Deltaproteobacteria bacterium]